MSWIKDTIRRNEDIFTESDRITNIVILCLYSVFIVSNLAILIFRHTRIDYYTKWALSINVVSLSSKSSLMNL
jgi:hypothetical protein